MQSFQSNTFNDFHDQPYHYNYYQQQPYQGSNQQSFYHNDLNSNFSPSSYPHHYNHHPHHGHITSSPSSFNLEMSNNHYQQSAVPSSSSSPTSTFVTTVQTFSSDKTRTRDKYRVVYNENQRLELEKEFYTSKYITIKRKSELANLLSLTERQVKIWFQNRRAKERKLVKKMLQIIENC